MGFLRWRHSIGDQLYGQMRRFTGAGSVFCALLALAGMLGVGDLRANGRMLEGGIWPSLGLLIVAIALATLRVTIFRDRRRM